MPIRRIASGDFNADRVSRNSAVPSSMTFTPGMNFRESSLGVVSVCMNMDRPGCTLTIHRSKSGTSKSDIHCGGATTNDGITFGACMPEAVTRVGPRFTAASAGVEEIDLVHDRTADSTVRFEHERALDRVLTDLEASLEDMAVISQVGLGGCV